MRETVTFGECLSEILLALNLKSSKLARELNIDASLLYKWLRGERIPSVDSPYHELFMNYISKRPLSPQQKTNLAEVLRRYGTDLSGTSDANILSGTSDAEILDKLKMLLQTIQRRSVRQREQLKKMKKRSPAKTTAEDCVQIIKGTSSALAAMIDLLKQAQKTPPSGNNKILLTISNDIKILRDKSGITEVWVKELYTLLKSGWKLVLSIVLDGDVSRTIRIIESIQTLLTTGNLSVYYYLKQPDEIDKTTELCIVPGIGGLLFFYNFKKKQADSAFLFRSEDSLELLAGCFFQNLNSSAPLLNAYPHLRTTEFQQAFAEYEETPGDKCVFKGGLSTATLPLDLYCKYLELAQVHDPLFSYRAFLHKRRLDAFEAHVQHYHYRDICFSESIIQLTENRKYSFDEEYLFEHSAPQKDDIIRHLEYMIELLEKHDNYNIAFVSMSIFQPLYNINWMAKGSSCVLIEINNGAGAADSIYPRMNFSITEKCVIHAFHNYFNELWDSIPDERKNKKNTVAWLKSQIESMTSNHKSKA